MKLLFLRLPCLSFIYFLLFIFLCFIFWSENFREHLLLAMQDLCLIVIKKNPLINEGIDMNILSFFIAHRTKDYFDTQYDTVNLTSVHDIHFADETKIVRNVIEEVPGAGKSFFT